jgi:hypothetical protein
MKLIAIRKYAGQSLECTYMMQINIHSRRVNERERNWHAVSHKCSDRYTDAGRMINVHTQRKI